MDVISACFNWDIVYTQINGQRPQILFQWCAPWRSVAVSTISRQSVRAVTGLSPGWMDPDVHRLCISINPPQRGGTWAHTHTPPFNGPLSGSTRVSRHQKGKINLDFTEARNSEWQWNPLGHMQVCTSLQTDNHASTPPLSFLQAEFPSCRPTNSVKALKASGGTWAQGQKICIPFVWLDDTMSCAQGLL